MLTVQKYIYTYIYIYIYIYIYFFSLSTIITTRHSYTCRRYNVKLKQQNLTSAFVPWPSSYVSALACEHPPAV